MQNDLTMDKPLLARFVRVIILQSDTPSLILELASNFHYLLLCREIVNSCKSINPKFFFLLNKVCREHNIESGWLKKRLLPAAKALGLQVERRYQLDYYEVLGIKKDANISEIKQAFRKKAYLTHPDTKKANSDDRYAFVEINDAYRTLSNEILRQHYDLSRQSLSKWHETPGPILKVKKSKNAFAFQLGSLLLVLTGLVYFFDIILHKDSMREGYAQPKSTETYIPIQIQKFPNEPSDLLMRAKKEATPQLYSDTIAVGNDGIPDGTAVQQNDFKDPPYSSMNEVESTIESDNNPNLTSSEPVATEATVITEKIDSKDNHRLTNNKTENIHIAVHEESKPSDSPPKKNVTKKTANQNTGIKGHSKTSVSGLGPKTKASAQPPENLVSSVATEKSEQEKIYPTVVKIKGDKIDMDGRIEKRLEQFLYIYCRTYEEKNLDKFVKYFTATAQENGKPFSSFIPKYSRNFSSIDEIKYQIKILKYAYDFTSGIVDFEGRFALEWLPNGENWHMNFGKIGMVLIEKNDSFLIDRLNYSGF